MISNEKCNQLVTELFIRGRKLNISLAFIIQSYFAVLKSIRLNSEHYFIMKNPNKLERQQIAFHHSSDIDFKDFINFYKKCTAKSFLFLVIDTILASDNSSGFRKNLLERILKLIMTIDEKCKDEKLQYGINIEVAKISALSCGKVDKYKYLLVEEIFLSDESRIIEKAKFTYSPLHKAFERQIKTIKGKKEAEALIDLKREEN